MPNPFTKTKSSPAAFTSVLRPSARRARKRRPWWQWGALALVVLLLAGGGYGVWLYYDTQGKIQEGGPGELPEVAEGKPFNVLLVGSDSREGLTEEEQLKLGASARGQEGERADSLILGHIDPATNRITMVQFPRDLYVPVGEGKDKINEALEQGPRHLVDVVEDLTGLTINRYVQVNIVGFRDLVDAIGGVSVCIPEPIPFDPKTGLEVPPEEVGMVHFSGNEALRFVRSRKVFEGGDFDRIRNQQKFLAAAINKLTSAGVLLRPDRILDLARIAGENLATDQTMTAPALKRLLDRFRSFDPENYEAYTVPNKGPKLVTLPSGIESWIVAAEPRAMNVVFEAIAHNESPAEYDDVPDVDLSKIRVGIYNGTLRDGVAARAEQQLEQATTTGTGPVRIVEVANAPRSGYRSTVVRYEPAAEAKATAVAAALPRAELRQASTRRGVDVEVIVGRRFRVEPIVQVQPLQLPEPTAPPKVCR